MKDQSVNFNSIYQNHNEVVDYKLRMKIIFVIATIKYRETKLELFLPL